MEIEYVYNVMIYTIRECLSLFVNPKVENGVYLFSKAVTRARRSATCDSMVAVFALSAWS